MLSDGIACRYKLKSAILVTMAFAGKPYVNSDSVWLWDCDDVDDEEAAFRWVLSTDDVAVEKRGYAKNAVERWL